MIQYIENTENINFRPGDSVRAIVEGPVFGTSSGKWGIITWTGICTTEENAKNYRFYSKTPDGYVFSNLLQIDNVERETRSAQVDQILQRSAALYAGEHTLANLVCAELWDIWYGKHHGHMNVDQFNEMLDTIRVMIWESSGRNE